MLGIFRSPVVPVVLVAFGIFLMWAGHKNAVEFAALHDHGRDAQAEITKLDWKEKRNSHIDSRYTVHIRFTTEDGREIHEEMDITTEYGRALRSQTTPKIMAIRYLPESPGTFRQASDTDPSEAQDAVGLYMLLAGIVMLVLRLFFRR